MIDRTLPAAILLALITLGAPAAGTQLPHAQFVLDKLDVDDGGRLAAPLREGYLALSWSAGDGDRQYELQSAPSTEFVEPVPRYLGADTTSFISGLEEGDHAFRIRARETDAEAWGPWSRPLVVPVRHHALATVWWLLGSGAVLFGLTVAVIAHHGWRGETPEAGRG